MPGLPAADSPCDFVSVVKRLEELARKRGRLAGAPPGNNVAQLPIWPEPTRGVPNVALRSALFGAIAKGKRRYVEREQLAALGDIQILYTGQRLDQGDLDAYQSVLHAARHQAMGEQCRVTSYALLKLMGKTDSGKNRATLHNRLTRLRANAVEIKHGRYNYIGGLINEAFRCEKTQEWVIVLTPKLRVLFAADEFTHIEWAVRHALDGQPLAQWLHGFYASHAKPYPMKIETLHRLCGSETADLWKFAQTLRKALNAVTEASAVHGGRFNYTVRGDVVHIEKIAKGTQRRHLAKKAAGSWKACAPTPLQQLGDTVLAGRRYRSGG